MKPISKAVIISGIFLSLSMLFSCKNTAEKERITLDGMVQGTYYHIVVYASDTTGLKNDIDSIFLAIDNSVSLWKENSLIVRINGGEDAELDSIFVENLRASQEISLLTDGAFDVTIGAMVKAHGFANKKREHLSQTQIDSIMQYVGWQNLKIENSHLIKKFPQTQLDFNAIAQGYTADKVRDYLRKRNIKSFIADIGGEVFAGEKKPDGKKWKVAIENPSADANENHSYNAFVELENQSIVTSGNYRKFYVENGIKYSHTIDPKTGKSVMHNLLSASVIAPTATVADGLATASMVMGLEKSKEFFAKHKEYDAYLIYSDKNGNFKTWHTEGFTKYLTE